MSNEKERAALFDKQIAHAIASQVPVHTVRSTYTRILGHAIEEWVTGAAGPTKLWACAKNGARIHARMVYRNIFDRATQQLIDRAPVVELFCSGCDKPPQTRKNDPIYSDELTTLSM